MVADELPRVSLRAQQPADHYLKGRAALNGPQPWDRRPWAGWRFGDVGGREENGGWSSTRSTLRSRVIASIGYLPEHAGLARHLALVVNELFTAGALSPNGPRNRVRVALY